MSPEAVSELYNDSAQTEYFSKLIAFMVSPCSPLHPHPPNALQC